MLWASDDGFDVISQYVVNILTIFSFLLYFSWKGAPTIGLQSLVVLTQRTTSFGSTEDMQVKASNKSQSWGPQSRWKKKFDNR